MGKPPAPAWGLLPSLCTRQWASLPATGNPPPATRPPLPSSSGSRCPQSSISAFLPSLTPVASPPHPVGWASGRLLAPAPCLQLQPARTAECPWTRCRPSPQTVLVSAPRRPQLMEGEACRRPVPCRGPGTGALPAGLAEAQRECLEHRGHWRLEAGERQGQGQADLGTQARERRGLPARGRAALKAPGPPGQPAQALGRRGWL